MTSFHLFEFQKEIGYICIHDFVKVEIQMYKQEFLLIKNSKVNLLLHLDVQETLPLREPYANK